MVHLMAVTPTRVGAVLAVDPLGGVGDGGLAPSRPSFSPTPEATVARLKELDAIEAIRPLDPGRAPGSHGDRLAGILLEPGGGAANPPDRPRPQRRELASIRAELPALADRLRDCTVPTRFVHGALDPLPVTASTDIADVLGATVDVLVGNGHFPWLEDPAACAAASTGYLLRLAEPHPVDAATAAQPSAHAAECAQRSADEGALAADV